MKALVVGGGSIGKRHLHNLRSLGVASLGLVEPDTERRKLLSPSVAAEFSSLEQGLDWKPDFVLIATPPHLHCRQALDVTRRGIDLFVEKPLSHSAEGMEELAELVARERLVSMVGCNMRFHPGPSTLHELISEGRLGKLLFGRIQVGSYLPDWRRGSDYAQNYAAKAETGGGCILDCVHEVDLARWYFGNVQQVFCSAFHLSSLKIETEDVAAIICRHASGTMSEIHLDYVQRSYERGCQIVGEKGSLFWDFRDRQVRWFDGESGAWNSFPQPAEWELNQMYLDELAHFLECVREREPTVLPIAEGVELMRVVFAAKASAMQHKMVPTAMEVFA
ncbi:MAG TPA: Gfo/Idh/MocA family oxidoreductase [Terriglobales bacterium]|nr:Gfo/Idh/MocA family oxidoreductase [Terriglobales bacterium]